MAPPLGIMTSLTKKFYRVTSYIILIILQTYLKKNRYCGLVGMIRFFLLYQRSS